MELQKIINGCFSIEQTIASIYLHFVQLFPEEQSFWKDLYKDEIEHSSSLTKYSFAGLIELLPTTDLIPTLEHVERSVLYVEERKKYIMSNPVNLEDALNLSLQLEETMVETFTNEILANVFAADYDSLSEKILLSEREHIDKIKEFMINKGFDVKFGARPLRRAIQKELEDPISMQILKGKCPTGSALSVSVRKEKLVFQIKKPSKKEEPAGVAG